MTTLSIIIPSYQCAERLRYSLLSVVAQPDFDAERVEVIVVDDGSIDDTQQVVASSRSVIRDLVYVHRARDADSSRARARNLGIAAARGSVLMFLDAGVIVGPGVLGAALAQADAGQDLVFLYKTLGLFASEAGCVERLALPSAQQFATLTSNPEWADVREPYFKPDGTPESGAAWLFGWTCALSVRRSAVRAIGGFDNAYVGYGVEDVDFAARLWRAGCRYRFRGDLAVLHLPHARPSRNAEEHRKNTVRLHHALRTRETELFCVWQDASAAWEFCRRLDQVSLARLSPWVQFSSDELARPGRALYVGLRWRHELARLRPAVVLVHEPSCLAQVASIWPQAERECLLGVALPYARREFDHALVGDLVRLLPRDLQRRLLMEMSRVARRVLLLFGSRTGREHVYRRVSGYGWTSSDDFLALARECGLQLAHERSIGAHAMLYELHDGAESSRQAQGPDVSVQL